MIISGIFFVIMHSAVKYLSQEIHPFEIAFRNVFVVIALAPLIVIREYENIKIKQFIKIQK